MEYMIDGALMEGIAEEIRKIDSSTSALTPAQMVSTLNGVKSSIGAALLALTGNKASTLSVNVADGKYYHYRAKMTDVDGWVAYSDAAMLSVAGYIAIVKQPEDVVAAAGDVVNRSVVAVGDGLTYQWQYSNDRGATWNNCSQIGYNTANFTFTMDVAYDGWYHRCIITDNNGNSVTTNEVVVSRGAIVITKQPVDVVGAVNDTVTLSVKAVGKGLSYQWQRSDDRGATWWDCPSGKAADWTFMMYESYDGIPYRCVVSDSQGNSVTTNVIKLWIASKVNITTQPVSVEANIGDTATFTVEADNVAVYQWQVSTDSGATWRNIPLTDEKYAVNSGNTVHDLARLIAEMTSQ